MGKKGKNKNTAGPKPVVEPAKTEENSVEALVVTPNAEEKPKVEAPPAPAKKEQVPPKTEEKPAADENNEDDGDNVTDSSTMKKRKRNKKKKSKNCANVVFLCI